MTVQDHSDAAGRDRGAAAAAASAAGGGREIGEAEFAAFYEENAAKLTTYLTRMAGRDDALVLVGQAFEQFFVWWPGNPGHPAPRAALYRIANCRLVDHLRRSGRMLTVEAGQLEKALIEGEHADGFAGVELRVDLERALSELSERQREALVLRYLADLPVRDCAAVLELGVDNMKKILKKALATLRTSPRMDSYTSAGRTEEVHR
ncbi:RNA polymerase sigma factor (sigma-70 family) [Streptomyces umbrinus]|uniref:RNA polymerase sigma factor n=1 Tax=Streptomyces umbrinus TaxID=67370 RepID=UPI00167C4A9F|nr:RNA polymerase sigma factor [Streptomyces umbrinus]MCR3732324.1 RNA polymerase sigma factor (sigma-70 family) [Streptomyces umbrinus]